MSSSKNQIYLITGANRGIGLALTTSYIARPNTTVIASVRSAADLTIQSMQKGQNSNLIMIEIDNASPTSAKAAIDSLQTTYRISRLDVVIANAGIQNMVFGPLANVDVEQVQDHISINTIGSLRLFQAVLPMLQKAAEPKLVVLGSPMGSIGGMEKRPVPMGTYGVSKAAVHYLVRKIHFENEGLVAFVVDPGFVQTESGNKAAAAFGMKEAATPVTKSVEFLVSTIDNATREKISGHFASIEGEDWAW